MPVCCLSPCRINRTQYQELDTAAQLVTALDGNSYALCIDADFEIDIVLKAELGSYQLIADLRIEADSEALRIVFIVGRAPRIYRL